MDQVDRNQSWIDGIILSASYVLLCAVQIWSLNHNAKPMSDEGVYLYAAKLIAEGHTPYDDFLLVHPPGVPYAVAAFFKLFGIDLFILRTAYIILAQSVMFPIYMIVRRRSSDIWPAVCAIAIWMGFVQLQNHDTRFVALRIVALVPPAWGLWFGLNCRRRLSAFLCGLSMSITLFITFSIVFVSGPLAVGMLWLWWRDKRNWGWLLAGLFAGTVPLLLTFIIPEAWECLVGFHAERMRCSWTYRMSVWWIVVGTSPVAFVLWLIGMMDRNPRVVWLFSLTNLIAMAGIFIIPRSNAMHYYNILGVTLAISSGLAVFTISQWAKASGMRRTYAGVVALTLAMTIVLQFGAVCLPGYYEKEAKGYFDLVARLRQCKGPLMTIEPIYALDADKDIPFHYHVADIRALKDLKTNISTDSYLSLLKKSSHYLEERHAAERIPLEVHEYIYHQLELIYQNPWGRIFRNPEFAQ